MFQLLHFYGFSPFMERHDFQKAKKLQPGWIQGGPNLNRPPWVCRFMLKQQTTKHLKVLSDTKMVLSMSSCFLIILIYSLITRTSIPPSLRINLFYSIKKTSSKDRQQTYLTYIEAELKDNFFLYFKRSESGDLQYI